jgi:hypothetical protein
MIPFGQEHHRRVPAPLMSIIEELGSFLFLVRETAGVGDRDSNPMRAAVAPQMEQPNKLAPSAPRPA